MIGYTSRHSPQEISVQTEGLRVPIKGQIPPLSRLLSYRAALRPYDLTTQWI